MGMFIVAGLPARWITTIVGVGAVGAVLLSISSEYRLQRLHVWFDPGSTRRARAIRWCSRCWQSAAAVLQAPTGDTAQQSLLICRRLIPTLLLLFFVRKTAFFGALILLLVFCLLGVAFYKITISTRDQKGFLLAAGVTFLIIGQAFANMAMVCGIFPVIGVPLIFISYGGSSMIIQWRQSACCCRFMTRKKSSSFLMPNRRKNAAMICVSWAAGGGSNEAFCFFRQ